jgi:hypothetical protein
MYLRCDVLESEDLAMPHLTPHRCQKCKHCSTPSFTSTHSRQCYHFTVRQIASVDEMMQRRSVCDCFEISNDSDFHHKARHYDSLLSHPET